MTQLRRYIPTFWLVTGLILSFTPYYTLGVVILIVLASARYPLVYAGFLHSLANRLVATFLFFVSWIMILAMYGWVVGLTLPAFIYIFSFVGIYTVLYVRYKPDKAASKPGHFGFRFIPLLSVVLSAFGLAVMVSSFYLPSPKLSSTIQIITNGYDNSAHLSLIRTTYKEGGYVYGDYETIKSKIAWKTLTAYPQGWHFTNAFFWKGLGIDVFGQKNISTQLQMYVLSLFFWYFLALLLFHQLLFHVLSRLKNINIATLHLALLVSAFSVLLQLLVFWGSLSYGFVTFLFAIIYLLLLSGLIFDRLTARTPPSIAASQGKVIFLLSVACLAAVTQGWLFAMPIAAGMIILGFWPSQFKKHFQRKYLVSYLALAATAVVILIPVLVQIMINLKFSTQGTSQVNDDGGIFGISSVLAAVLVTAGLVATYTGFLQPKIRLALSAITLPALGFTGLLLLYQLVTLGHPAYFFTKSLALTLCLLWIPLCCGGLLLFSRILNRVPTVHAIGALIVTFLFVPFLLGQDTTSFKRLLQRQSNVTSPIADELAISASNGDLVDKRVYVFTHEKYDGDVIGSIFSLTAAQSQDECTGDALWVIITRRPEIFSEYANLCSPERAVTVIASPDSKKKFLSNLEPGIKVTLYETSR